MTASKAFDFDSAFVSTTSQEDGAEFEAVNDRGEKTGFFIRLAGPDSQRRKRTRARLVDFGIKNGAASQAATMNRKARRAANAAGIEKYSGEMAVEFDQLTLDDLVAATISWRFADGVSGPECTPENARRIYTLHPTLLEQVDEFANNIDHFTKR